jgi:hypothetical protein
MAIPLPPSLRRELHPVEEEVVEYRALSPEARLRLAAMACRVAADLARARPDHDLAFEWRDEVPASTERAFARLGVAWSGR